MRQHWKAAVQVSLAPGAIRSCVSGMFLCFFAHPEWRARIIGDKGESLRKSYTGVLTGFDVARLLRLPKKEGAMVLG